MKENKFKTMALFLKTILIFLIIAGAIIVISIVAVNVNTAYSNGTDKGFNFIFNCILFLTGSFSLLFILYNLERILESVISVTPFIRSNVRSLKRIAVSCFIISATYVLNFFFNNQFRSFDFISIDSDGIHTDMEFLIFFFAGCFILILAQVYKQAVDVKEENDFTI